MDFCIRQTPTASPAEPWGLLCLASLALVEVHLIAVLFQVWLQPRDGTSIFDSVQFSVCWKYRLSGRTLIR